MSRFMCWFNRNLRKRPLLTNTLVYASFYTAAELSQQSFNIYYTREADKYDLASAARIVAVGSLVYPPTLYVWYKYLDRKFVGTSLKTVATKVVSDQFFMTPILLAIFFILLGALEGKEDIFEELRAKYKTAIIANQCFWLPGQTINFGFIPSHLRVVYVSAASFIWINVLCFIKRQKYNAVDEKLGKK